MRKPFMIPVACFALLLLSHSAMASVSLGSVTGARSIKAWPGDVIRFETFLFNIHENSMLAISMDVEGPEGWAVSADPEAFELDFYPAGRCITKEGYVCLSTGLGGVMARPARFTVEVPSWAEKGKYTTKAWSHASIKGTDTRTQQSRVYDFVVDVVDGSLEPKKGEDNAPKYNLISKPKIKKDVEPKSEGQLESESKPVGDAIDSSPKRLIENYKEGVTGMAASGIIGTMILASIVVIILLASWRIYRH